MPVGSNEAPRDRAGQIERYDPPGFMTDFEGIPGQLEQWSAAVSGWFDEVIAIERESLGKQPCQYYNQLLEQPSEPLEQEIVWNAFPGTLCRRFGEAVAMKAAEIPMPLTQREDGQGEYFVGPAWTNLFYRPHDEYCEWRVERDDEGRIVRVTFTSEPPEYWQALHGDVLANFNEEPTYPTTGDPGLLLDLYREYVNPGVQLSDLVCAEDLVDYSEPAKPRVVYAKGTYNPYNRWNTTDGIMHLTQPANSLQAEIKLGGDATILLQRDGRRITDPDALICAARYGGANRRTDPTIGASVNELAALGCAITLRNPVGLYMDHLELTGWTKPDGSPVEPEYFRILRGRPGLIERAVFEVPEDEGFTVSDVRIGGVPISFGGQLAQFMTVKLVGLAANPGSFSNEPVEAQHSCCIDPANREYLIQPRPERDCAGEEIPAFDYPDVQTTEKPTTSLTEHRLQTLRETVKKRPQIKVVR
jgi:hypothetical protein